MRLSRTIFVVVIMISVNEPTLLLAGPIDWSYSTTLTSASNPNLPYAYVRAGGSGAGSSWDEWVNFVPQSQNREVGSEKILVGLALPTPGNAALDSVPTFDKNFRVTVLLTDAVSKMTGSVDFTGYFVTDDSLYAPVTMQYTSPSEQSVVIGGNRYDVTLPYQSAGDLYATVNVAPVVATPEPTSLGLVLVSASALFVARRMRARDRSFAACSQPANRCVS